jgi:hypothetical protein
MSATQSERAGDSTRLTLAQRDILTQLRIQGGVIELPGRSIRPVRALAEAGFVTYRERWEKYRNGRIVKILTVKAVTA